MGDFKHRHSKLCETINHHDKLYYQEDAPEISDAEYDMIRSEIKDLEDKYPELITADSPTQKVGAPLRKGFAQVIHSKPMLSLQNANSAEELRLWAHGVEKRLKKITVEQLARFTFIKSGDKVEIVDYSKYCGIEGVALTDAVDPFQKVSVQLFNPKIIYAAKAFHLEKKETINESSRGTRGSKATPER